MVIAVFYPEICLKIYMLLSFMATQIIMKFWEVIVYFCTCMFHDPGDLQDIL